MAHNSCALLESWQFRLDPGDLGLSQGWALPEYDASGWEAVTVPHTWNAGAGRTDSHGVAWYRCALEAPETSGAWLRVRFEAAFYQAQVWLNGTYLGMHEGGYTPFEFGLAAAWRDSGENMLAVRVDSARALNRLPADLPEGGSYGWNTYGGLVRPATLLATPPVYLTAVRIVSEPHLSAPHQAGSAEIRAFASVRNTALIPFTGSLRLLVSHSQRTSAGLLPHCSQPGSASDLGENSLLYTQVAISIPPGASSTIPWEAVLPDPRLWHFDQPNLYSLQAMLFSEMGDPLCDLSSNFGLRQIELKAAQFILNGEAVRLVGLSRHADHPACGLAETPAVLAADFDDLKRLNMVFSRPAHYPQHEYVYEYCDRNGILLIPELPAWQLSAGQMADPPLRALARQQLREMVEAAANHPCIWAWSVGNELESDTVAGREFVRDMIAWVKECDPARPVGFASYHLLVGRPWADATRHADFVMMNEYFGSWHGPKDALPLALETVHQAWPDKPLIISEFGFMPGWEQIEGPQKIDPQQYYRAEPGSPAADLQRQLVLHDQLTAFRLKPYVAAAVFWTYRGVMGVVDETGARRASWEQLRHEFSPAEIRSFQLEATHARIEVRARGPWQAELPAYTLRGYSLRCEIYGPEDIVLVTSDLPIPELPPGAIANLRWEFSPQPDARELRLLVLRPTGFSVTEEVVEWDTTPEPEIYDGYLLTDESAEDGNFDLGAGWMGL